MTNNIMTCGLLYSRSLKTSMKRWSCSEAVSGKPPTGFDMDKAPSISLSHNRRS